MTVDNRGRTSLEDIMFRLMENRPEESTDHTGVMLMISLVNLLGIISVMNKQASFGTAFPSPKSMGEDPLISALLANLGQGQNQQPERGGSPGINPALLLSLLGSRGDKPENLLLAALLSRMMQPPPQNPAHAEKEKHTPAGRRENSEAGKGNAGAGPGEPKKQGALLAWDRRLG
jgi:hypothetical protein